MNNNNGFLRANGFGQIRHAPGQGALNGAQGQARAAVHGVATPPQQTAAQQAA
ncbi:MAG: hypothetical protein LW832_00610 [Parachlamydia sp.]|nr:hypothetical protein [Parachlamydia sp.]